jgi:hypothetical protein
MPCSILPRGASTIYADALRDGRLRSEPDLAVWNRSSPKRRPSAPLLPADGSEDGLISRRWRWPRPTPPVFSSKTLPAPRRGGYRGHDDQPASLGIVVVMPISHGGSLAAPGYALDARGCGSS